MRALRRHVLALGIGAGLTLLVILAALILFGRRGQKKDQPPDTQTAASTSILTESPSVTPTPTSTATPTATAPPSPALPHTPTPLPSSTSTTTPSPTPYSFYFSVNAEQLNIYAAPGENYEVLYVVRRGDRLLAAGRLDDGTWWQVDFFGMKGWVPAQPVGPEVNPANLPVVTPPAPLTITPSLTPERVLGYSVSNQEISMTVIGDETGTAIVIVGALDGTQANTRDLVHAMTSHLKKNPQDMPSRVTFYLVPSINPDGVATNDRYNANGVDINRNWGTADWTPNPGEPGYPEGKPGAGGPTPFSEPETRALRDLLLGLKRQEGDVRLVALHSSVTLLPGEGQVFPGSSISGPHDSSVDIAERFAREMMYSVETEWRSYPTPGDVITWCAEQGITSIDVVFSKQDVVSSLQTAFVHSLLETIR